MSKKDNTTEQKILDAANDVFLAKGFDGTRMQQIADEAKINKSLLHYYYRTKEKLFAEVFNKVIHAFLPDTIKIFEEDKSLFEKIEIFTKEYISLLQKNPVIPLFVLHELNKKPKKIAERFANLFETIRANQIAGLQQEIEKEVENKTIKPIDANQLIVNIMSLCIFPFAAKPIINKLLFDDNTDDYKQFIEQRKTEVSSFVINSIKL